MTKEPARPIVAEIVREHDAFTRAAASAVEHAITCGLLLAKAKADVGHGEWLPWVEANLPFGVRQVQKYMRLAQHAGELPNANSNAHLTIDGALALLAPQRTIFDELTDLGCKFTPVSLDLPEGLTFEAWARIGELLQKIENGSDDLAEWFRLQVRLNNYGEKLLAAAEPLEERQKTIMQAVESGEPAPDDTEDAYARACEWVARAENWRRACARRDLALANAKLKAAVEGKLRAQRDMVMLDDR